MDAAAGAAERRMSMDEYVTKEQVIDWYRPYGQTDEPIPFETLVSDLRDMKAADVAPVRHGRWLDGQCIVCGWEEPDICTWLGYDSEAWIETPYCPNCGCKMDLEE